VPWRCPRGHPTPIRRGAGALRILTPWRHFPATPNEGHQGARGHSTARPAPPPRPPIPRPISASASRPGLPARAGDTRELGALMVIPSVHPRACGGHTGGGGCPGISCGSSPRVFIPARAEDTHACKLLHDRNYHNVKQPTESSVATFGCTTKPRKRFSQIYLKKGLARDRGGGGHGSKYLLTSPQCVLFGAACNLLFGVIDRGCVFVLRSRSSLSCETAGTYSAGRVRDP
jgi:hypothetical protein